jgi:hypothetical protein
VGSGGWQAGDDLRKSGFPGSRTVRDFTQTPCLSFRPRDLAAPPVSRLGSLLRHESEVAARRCCSQQSLAHEWLQVYCQCPLTGALGHLCNTAEEEAGPHYPLPPVSLPGPSPGSHSAHLLGMFPALRRSLSRVNMNCWAPRTKVTEMRNSQK